MRDWLVDALAQPDRVFLESANETLTFGELAQRVGEWTGGASGQLAPAARIGVWAYNELDSVVAMFAAPRAGLVPLLLDPRWPVHRTRLALADAGAVAVTGAGEEVGLPTFRPSGSFLPPDEDVDPSRVHSVVFTSGTSGPPKGVRLTWRNLEASAAGSAHNLRHTQEERWLCVLPVCHVGGLGILIRSLRERSTVLLEPSFDPERVASILDGQATIASLVTATLRRLIDTGQSFSGVRAVLVGGGPVPTEIVEEARAVGLPAFATYGMTETASQVAAASLDALDPEWLEPLAGAELSIEGGRIAVSGEMVSPGYLDEADLGTPFVTSDRGEIVGGRLRVLGRVGDVFVSGGENVDPAEVEARLRSIPGVVEAAVVGVPDPTWGSLVGAAIEVEAGTRLEAVVEAARRGLAPYQVPRRWKVVTALPQLAIGKIDRAAVQALLERAGTN